MILNITQHFYIKILKEDNEENLVSTFLLKHLKKLWPVCGDK